MKRYSLGIDTSNYTTSVALVDNNENVIVDNRQLLNVRQGERGLRQQEALFQHIRNLPVLLENVITDEVRAGIDAVAVSVRPRPVEGSYMPCFNAGAGAGKILSEALGTRFMEFSHQEGHIAAVAPGHLNHFLCYHLSGGTAELLEVYIRRDCETKSDDEQITGETCTNESTAMKVHIIGRTRDISPGQLLDRCGVLCGYDFPAGAALDEIALSTKAIDLLTPVKLDGLDFNLSGMETQFSRLIAEHNRSQTKEQTKDNASDEYADELIADMMGKLGRMLIQLTEKARKETGITDVVFAGGVSMSRYLRNMLQGQLKDIYFGEYSSDNAVGTALLGGRMTWR